MVGPLASFVVVSPLCIFVEINSVVFSNSPFERDIPNRRSPKILSYSGHIESRPEALLLGRNGFHAQLGRQEKPQIPLNQSRVKTERRGGILLGKLR